MYANKTHAELLDTFRKLYETVYGFAPCSDVSNADRVWLIEHINIC